MHYLHKIFPILAILLCSSAAFASKINTGGADGAYHNKFCTPLKKGLEKSHFNYQCAASKGAVDNLKRVREKPAQVGFSQFDVYALEISRNAGTNPFKMIRSDIARECLFMVSKNIDMDNFGQVSAHAQNTHFILPPEGSGSVATFEFLQQLDPDGLGKARNITFAKNTHDALKMALETDDGSIALFVQFPDPNNERFKMIHKMGGHFIPVIDRNILRQQIGGKKVYYAQETGLTNPILWKKGVRVVTACTPLVLFTGNPELLPAGQSRLDQEDLIQTIGALPISELLPKKGFFSSFWERTKSLPADGIEKILTLSEKAREAAAPALKKAKDIGKKAVTTIKNKALEMRQKAAGSDADRASKQADEAAPVTKE